jgi:spore maturation protein CgeB
MVMLAGGFYAGEYTSGMAQMLEDGVHCVWYRDLDECVTRCKEFLADDSRRLAIKAEGEHYVRSNHTYDQRVPFILENKEWVNPLAR